MPDMLGTGLSSLRALQRALDTTAHNIANVSTPGYSRQRVEFQTRQPSVFGASWIGNGVDVSQVRRIYDQFLTAQARDSSGNLARLDAFATQAERLDNMLGDTTNGLSTSLQSYTDALSEVSSTPSSNSARQVLLSQGRALAQRLQDYDKRLREMSADIDTRFAGEAREVTLLAQGIARLNGEITVGTQNTGQAPNDLLDERDRLIDQIASKVSVTTVAEGVGTINVFIGNGQPLVLGTTSSEITTVTDPFDPERTQFALKTAAGTVDISRGVSGGTLGGLLDWRREMLEPARNELGRISLAIANQVNAQHREGMDLSGALGGDFFNVGGVGTTDVTTNTGTAVLTATRTNIGAITGGDYILSNTGSGYTLRRQDSGAPVTFTGAGTIADPILADGLSIVVGAGSASGDQYIIHPTRDAVRGFGVAITDPTRIAAAAPIRGAAATGNSGSGTISPGEVLNVANAQLLTTANIVFTSPTQYTINGGPVQTFTAGSNIDANGWRVQISGAPAAGDTFTVRSNAGATGDNRNVFALADALGAGVLEGGTVSVANAVERLTADVGLQTRTAQVNRDAEAAVNSDDLDARDSVSGVNLDEEAAAMLRYQQAYQAAAQIIATASNLFDSLLNAVRR
ncbi:MAG TPA: flagellar hook-associated protein FlgK [Steroidobacteraceae bacterium]|nr:flagellar hook-associated protein FlgK [Steroidobacteraceae bacterium]